MPPTTLAFDPGVKNFAFVVLDGIDLVASGWVTPLTDVSSPATYVNSILELLARHSPDYVVCERFQFRGPSSKHSEAINQAIGILAAVCLAHGRELQQVTPSTWKRWRDAGGNVGAAAGLPTVHERDAAGIAAWAASSMGLAPPPGDVRALDDGHVVDANSPRAAEHGPRAEVAL